MSDELQDVIDAIFAMDNDELNKVIEAVKERRNTIARKQKVMLSVGDRVTFDGGRKHGQVTGTLIKKNPKNVKVRSDKGVMWTVNPLFLDTIEGE